MNFGNIATAMVTPFDKNENIDFQKLSKLIDYLINNGTDSLVVAGTTGESPTLSEEEKVALIQYSVKERQAASRSSPAREATTRKRRSS